MALQAGDIAFIGYNFDGTQTAAPGEGADGFGFVALVEIPADETILFTDHGWISDVAGFRAKEGVVTWTATESIAAGTVVTVEANTPPGATAQFVTSHGTVSESGTYALSGSGDQIFAFQGTVASPVFLAAIHSDSTGFAAEGSSSNDSALPGALTEGTNAVAIPEIDNAYYTGSTEFADKDAALAAINDPANWAGSNTGPLEPATNWVSSVTLSDTSAPTVAINEVRISSSGSSDDTSNFVELFGTPNASTDGLTLVALQAEPFNDITPGDVTFAIDLTGGSFDGNGFLLIANTGTSATTEGGDVLVADLDFPGAPTTFLLVENFTGAVGDDLDTDDDGTLNSEPWDAVVASLALTDGDTTEDKLFAGQVVGPDGNFTPAYIFRPTDGTGDFTIGAFGDQSSDTPGFSNEPTVASLAIEATDAVKAEGDSGTTTFTFTVTRSGLTTGTTNVDFVVTGDADAADFGGTLPSGTVSFAADETTQTIEISVSGDMDEEPNENFTVTLSNATGGATLTTATANGTIQNDDNTAPLPSLVINEINADPDTTDGDANGDGTPNFGEDEFVEIVNTGATSVDLSGFTISDAAVTPRHVFPENTLLQPGQAIVVFGGGTPTGDFGGAIVQTASSGELGLNNSGDTVTVANATGTTVVEQAYGSEGSSNQSLTRDPDLTGDFAQHSTATGSDGSLFSPGTQIDGTAFGEGDPQPSGPILLETFDYAEDGTVPQFTLTDGEGNPTTFFYGPSNFDYFGIRDGDGDGGEDFNGDTTNGFNSYTGLDDNHLAGSDTDGDGGTLPKQLTWSGLDISGRSTLQLSAALATDDGSGALDPTDFVIFEYRVDGGEWIPVLAFETADDSTFNQDTFLQDTDFDGIGDGTALTPAAQTFVGLIEAEGSSLDLRLQVSLDSGFEDIGIDTITLDDASGDFLSVAETDAVKAEGDSGTTDFTFTVTRTGDTTGETTVDFAVSGDADAADFGGTLPIGTVTFSDGETSQTITVQVSGDTDAEADEGFTVALTNASDGTTILTDNALGTIQNDDGVALTAIYDIQGSGEASALDGQTVTTTGIVTAIYEENGGEGELQGFFLQDATGDDDATTSDGIFVFTGGTAAGVSVGDEVQITGTVTEFNGETQIGSVTNVTTLSTENALPDATVVDLPTVGTTTNSNGVEIADLEHVEGMLVTFEDELTVTELFNLDRFGEMRVSEGGRLEQFTQNNDPDVAGFTAHLTDIASRTITIDDGFRNQNPDLDELTNVTIDENGDGVYNTADEFGMGDTVDSLTGVVRFSNATNEFGNSGSNQTNYRILPTEEVTFTNDNPREEEAPEIEGADLTIASFNVLNYFTTLDQGSNTTITGQDPRGADNQTELDRQTEKLVTTILELDADILALNELENDFTLGDGNAVAKLVAELNDASGSMTYAFVDPGVDSVGSDAIAVGFIYKPDVVEVTTGTTVEVLEDSDLEGLGLTDLGGDNQGNVFDGVNTNRNPVAASFTEIASGETFTAAVVHMKSKGGTGTGDNADQGDGQGNWNETRTEGAIALDAWLDSDPTGSGDEDFIILGDLNAYAQEDPVSFLESEGYVNLAAEFVGPDAYSFVFDGQQGTLDYGFANASMFEQVIGAEEWHINSDEPDALDYNTDFGRDPAIFDGSNPARNSDHDPLVVGVSLGTAEAPVTNVTTGETFETIQAAVDAASAGDEISIAAGTFNESVTIGKPLSISGAGADQTVVAPTSGSGFDITGDLGTDATLSIDGIGFTGGVAGVDYDDNAVLGTLSVTNAAFEANSFNGIRIGGNANPVDLDAVIITNSTFTGNGEPQTSSGDGDILFFQYNGDATIRNVDITGQDRGNGAAENGIQFRGDTGSLGTVVLENVTVAGVYEKQPVAFFNYDDLGGLSASNVVVTADSTNFDIAGNVSGVTGDIDLSSIDFTGAPDPLALTGDNAAQTITSGAEDALLTGRSGNDLLIGGDGVDTAIYSGSSTDYAIVVNPDGSLTVTDLNAADGDEGADTVRADVEALFFLGDAVSILTDTLRPDGLELPQDPAFPVNPAVLPENAIDGNRGEDNVDDIIIADDSGQKLDGRSGSDILIGGAGDDNLRGRDGDDFLFGLGGNDELVGDQDNDVLYGGADNDKLKGRDGDDFLSGGLGDDRLEGDDGDDTIVFGIGEDDVRGEEGDDTYIADGVGSGSHIREVDLSDTIDLSRVVFGVTEDANPADFVQVVQDGSTTRLLVSQNGTGDSFVEVVSFKGDASGLSLAELINQGIVTLGTGGTIDPDPGSDPATGLDVTQTVDTLPEDSTGLGGTAVASFTVTDADGGTVLSLSGADAGLFEIEGGQIVFRDGASLDFETNPSLDLTVNADGLSEAISVAVTDVEEATDPRLPDDPDLPEGLDADSAIDGLKGENGVNDFILGTEAGEKLDGRSGDDTLVAAGGDDTLRGRDGEDLLFGGSGNDELVGDGGNDTLYGGADDDKLKGREGDDILDGGAGNDWLEGDGGSDTFVFDPTDGAQEDQIRDFEIGVDQIDLSAFPLASFGEATAGAFQDGSHAVLLLDNGDGSSTRIEIRNTELSALGENDFLFSSTV